MFDRRVGFQRQESDLNASLSLHARSPLLTHFKDLPPRVGILGGTFDPVHDGHLGAALAAIEKHSLDMVILLPVGQNPLKAHMPHLSNQERCALLLERVRRVPQLYVSDFEIAKSVEYLTIDTLLDIKRQNPQTRLFFILGMDNVQKMPRWVRMDEYRKTVEFVPVGRNGVTIEECHGLDEDLKSELDRNFVNLDMRISSTELRTAALR